MRSSIAIVLSLFAIPSIVACSSGPEPLPPVGAEGADGGAALPGPQGTGPRAGGDDVPQQGEPAPLPPAPAPKADDITEASAIFVAKHGDANNPGTRRSPLSSIAAAIAKAKNDKKARVFVCEGSYDETLTIENGISLVGGLDCASDSWKLTDKRSTLASPSSPAIRANGIDKPTRVDNFDVTSPDAVGSSRSSIGVLAVGSNALTFAKGSIAAGAGSNGDDGVEAKPLFLVVTEAAGMGGWILTRTQATVMQQDLGGNGAWGICYDSENLPVTRQRGGNGESSGVFYHSDANVPWSASIPAIIPQETVPIGGQSGANGANAAQGTLGDDGFVAADGTAGASGEVGTGGLGATKIMPYLYVGPGFWTGQSGPGGGPGGCPGVAGTPGKGGGASLGVVAVRSPLRLEDMTVTSSTGGAGGKGTFGSQPTMGGPGGRDSDRYTSPPGFSTPGGLGGAAGISGNGAPGPSIAIAYRGAAPVLTRATSTPGAGGAAIEARSANGKTIPASPAGLSEQVKEL